MRNQLILLGFFAALIVTAVVAQEQPQPGAEDITDADVSAFDLETIVVRAKASANASLSNPPLKAEDADKLGLNAQPEINAVGSFVYRTGLSFSTIGSGKEKLRKLLEIIQGLRKRDDIEYAKLNPIYYLQAEPDDADYPKMWHYHNNGRNVPGKFSRGGISLPVAWKYTKGSADLTVAVLDTGFLPDHPDIKDSKNVGTGYDFVSDLKYSNDGDGWDSNPADPGDSRPGKFCADAGPGSEAQPDSWHGSHVAGIIGIGVSNNRTGIAGINFNLRVLPVRIGGKCGANNNDVLAAILWSSGRDVQNVPHNEHPARIINLGYGRLGTKLENGCDPDLQLAIDEAVKAGSIIVVPAGNDGEEADKATIAGCKNVVVVAASSANGLLVKESNHGRKVDIMAPGYGIWSYVKPTSEKPDGVDVKNGTSMAAAHVSGVLALMAAQNPKLTNTELISTLKRNAAYRSKKECPNGCGAGLLDAGKAVAAVAEMALSPWPPQRQARSEPPAKPKQTEKPSKTAEAPSRSQESAAKTKPEPGTHAQQEKLPSEEPSYKPKPQKQAKREKPKPRWVFPPRPETMSGCDCACPCYYYPPCDRTYYDGCSSNHEFYDDDDDYPPPPPCE